MSSKGETCLQTAEFVPFSTKLYCLSRMMENVDDADDEAKEDKEAYYLEA